MSFDIRVIDRSEAQQPDLFGEGDINVEDELKEADALGETRDYLLPKLLSGEVEVEEAGELAEAV